MPDIDKWALSERDICTKFITPALMAAGSDVQTQIREEVNPPKGRVLVSSRVHRRGGAKRTDYSLHYRPNLPLAIIEEALLRQCDALAAQWHQIRTLGAHLLDSTLHHLLAA